MASLSFGQRLAVNRFRSLVKVGVSSAIERRDFGETLKDVGIYDYTAGAIGMVLGTVKAGGKVALKTAKKFGGKFVKRFNETRNLRHYPANKNMVRGNVEALDLAGTSKRANTVTVEIKLYPLVSYNARQYHMLNLLIRKL